MVRPDDGRVLHMYSAGVAPQPGEGGGRRVIGVVRDITERHAEDDARIALVAELDHRVKNVLASVQSLAAQSARKTTSLDAFLKTFAGPAGGDGLGPHPAHRHPLARRRDRQHRRRRARRPRARPGALVGAGDAAQSARHQRVDARFARARHQRGEVRGALGRDRPRRGGVDPARGRRLRAELERARRPFGQPADADAASARRCWSASPDASSAARRAPSSPRPACA